MGETYTPIIVKIDNEEAVKKIAEMGGVILHRRDELLLTCIPDSKVDSLAGIKQLQRAEMTGVISPTMDNARPFGNVDKVFSMTKYTGDGVLVGFSDIGFDPNNPEFIDAQDGKSRVKSVIAYNEFSAERKSATTADEIASWTSDNYGQWHATHVGGIMAGGYKGNNYYGVATGANILATTSELSDVGILSGIEEMIEYAKQEKKPLAINLSLGSYTGPHDGTDLFCQYLDRCGKEAIVCISAGNEANGEGSQTFDYTEDDQEHKTLIQSRIGYDGMKIYGDCDWWSADSRPMDVQIGIYDMLTRESIYSSPWIGQNAGLSSWSIASSELKNAKSAEASHNETFDACFSGGISVSTELNEENNRYNILVSYNLSSLVYYPDKKFSRYYISIAVRAKKGVHVNGYTDQETSFFTGAGSAYCYGNGEQSVSSIACGKNVMVIGASNSRNSVNLVDGTTKKWSFDTSKVASFSGYGTLIDGRKLPHISAPGNYIVSSISSYYNENKAETYAVDKQEYNGRTYYWGAHCGTSMACPYATGVVALWLQANPTLTIEDVRKIAQATAITSYDDITDSRWGAGEIDAYAGLTMASDMAGVDNVTANDNGVSIKVMNKTIAIESSDKDYTATIYSTNGGVMKISNESVIDCSNLAKGIYLLIIERENKARQVVKIAL
jgi:subtilisin family serine protease